MAYYDTPAATQRKSEPAKHWGFKLAKVSKANKAISKKIIKINPGIQMHLGHQLSRVSLAVDVVEKQSENNKKERDREAHMLDVIHENNEQQQNIPSKVESSWPSLKKKAQSGPISKKVNNKQSINDSLPFIQVKETTEKGAGISKKRQAILVDLIDNFWAKIRLDVMHRDFEGKLGFRIDA